MSAKHKNPCPCCGHLVFDGKPGTEEICPVCYWQDDDISLSNPFEAFGPNKVSLHDAQRIYLLHGVCDISYSSVRHRLADPKQYPVDVGWRLIDPACDRFLKSDGSFLQSSNCYYWR